MTTTTTISINSIIPRISNKDILLRSQRRIQWPCTGNEPRASRYATNVHSNRIRSDPKNYEPRDQDAELLTAVCYKVSKPATSSDRQYAGTNYNHSQVEAAYVVGCSLHTTFFNEGPRSGCYGRTATMWWRWWGFFCFSILIDHQWNETERGKPKYLEKKLSRCHFVHHKSHKDRPGIEPGPPRWEAGD